MLPLGTQAPEFELPNETGESLTLREMVSDGPLMIVFYPADFTPICTRQLCGYQNAYPQFRSYGMNVVGISSNTQESHKKFRSKYNFAFHLLSDPKKKVFKLFEVTSFFMLGGTSRAIFIVAKGGRMIFRYIEPTILTHRSSNEILKILEKLRVDGQI